MNLITNYIIVGTEFVYLNGVLQESPGDYTYATQSDGYISTITFGATPSSTDKLTIAGQIIA